MARKATFLAFGCTHCPLEDEAFIEWLIEQIKERKPDKIIHAGDLYEADSASRWPSEYDWTIEDEYWSSNNLLKRIRLASPESERIFLPGNHDDNILALGRINQKVRGRCNWKIKQYDEHNGKEVWLNEELVTQWRRPCEHRYCRKSGIYRLGQVTFAHGYEANQSADEFQSILLGLPYGLWVGAHTHRPREVTQAKRTMGVPLPYWFANVGCARNMKPPYMHRKRTHQWGQAIVVGECELLQSPRISRRWEAETVIFRMHDD